MVVANLIGGWYILKLHGFAQRFYRTEIFLFRISVGEHIWISTRTHFDRTYNGRTHTITHTVAHKQTMDTINRNKIEVMLVSTWELDLIEWFSRESARRAALAVQKGDIPWMNSKSRKTNISKQNRKTPPTDGAPTSQLLSLPIHSHYLIEFLNWNLSKFQTVVIPNVIIVSPS